MSKPTFGEVFTRMMLRSEVPEAVPTPEEIRQTFAISRLHTRHEDVCFHSVMVLGVRFVKVVQDAVMDVEAGLLPCDRFYTLCVKELMRLGEHDECEPGPGPQLANPAPGGAEPGSPDDRPTG